MHILVRNAAADQPAPRRMLACPVCDSPRVTITHLDCRALGPMPGEVQVGRDGLRVDPTTPGPEGGATIGLRCACDQGHDSVIRFRQLRGATCIDHILLPWTAPSTRADLN
jgi:hypothetical protein